MTRALVACWVAFLAASPSHAQSVEEFYTGKTVSLYIGSSVGGGYDAYGRLVARHIGKYIPGNPTIVPLNMEGTGSLRLTNWLYEAAPQDGTVFGLLNRGLAWSALKTARPQWLEDGSINILIQLGLRERPELSNVPSVMDIPLNPEERQILRLIMLRGYFGRPFVAPPNVPGERAAVLRAAFAETLTEPQLLREAEQLRVEIGPVSGERLDELLIEAYDTAPELVERARELLN